MNEQTTIWTCSCGKRLKLAAAQIESRKEVCPHCGAPVGHDKSDPPPLSPSDTQMINIGDMARMAQEGIDPAVSGEWDTSKTLRSDLEAKPNKKKR